ncbi:AbiV family abortive infection protein [Lentzea flava]|uniref:AbiV family abortive infection protein n=1 Tax=Lentzea flava TaxID=103732 RepID=A0ABQ2UN34_9PSEU|nr:AbiV family abortive infection protein [Lentzea flava]MCP2200051.1 abortive infection protein, AbiV family [Lentzea flava]GGU45818.1 hypothetical protein GCM10010178_42870 [Lentzea flava]
MAKRPLTPTELDQLGQAALSNALELLADARLLFEAERWPRAFALATLAGEEVGKYEACRQAASNPPADDAAWKTFWKDLRDHKPKFATMSGPLVDSISAHYPAYSAEGRKRWDWVRTTLTDRNSDLAKLADKNKMAAFYVDFDDDSVSVPNEIVHRVNAENMINMVSRAIAYLPPQSSSAGLEPSTAALPAWWINGPTT